MNFKYRLPSKRKRFIISSFILISVISFHLFFIFLTLISGMIIKTHPNQIFICFCLSMLIVALLIPPLASICVSTILLLIQQIIWIGDQFLYFRIIFIYRVKEIFGNLKFSHLLTPKPRNVIP